eukprot:CAMPEP_0201549570 /NCGR_PEP_ID=MMETSP0173_2-20130828/6037_1 /ASSEMBLY_ACC=CAM_ASM_000268 /TAXON_ID=218659 /ORGANISM="Vexillifera sp., Strain DIVA3 564/2" /LENGTH=164 /DNA_ID=CAMNT_0047959281 /DNA_START=504 /DNA_END=995 /DNA_ORIENTATION=-
MSSGLTMCTTAAASIGGFPIAVNETDEKLSGWSLQDHMDALTRGNQARGGVPVHLFSPESIAVLQKIMHDYYTVKKGEHVFVKTLAEVTHRSGQKVQFNCRLGFVFNEENVLYAVVKLSSKVRAEIPHRHMVASTFIHRCSNPVCSGNTITTGSLLQDNNLEEW